jgi:hypothetical protein
MAGRAGEGRQCGERMTATVVPETFVLYRFFDAGGDLLYIGKSVNVWSRFTSHRRTSKFYPEAARVELQRGFASAGELDKAEVSAIRAEHPKFNIVHNDTTASRPAYVATSIEADTPAPPATIDQPKWQAGVWNRISPWDDLPLLADFPVVRVYLGDIVIAQGILDDYHFGCAACEEEAPGLCGVCQSFVDDGEEPPEDLSYFLNMIGEDFRGSSRVTGNNFDGSRPFTGWFDVAVDVTEDTECRGPEGISVYIWVTNDADDEITRTAWALVHQSYGHLEDAS